MQNYPSPYELYAKRILETMYGKQYGTLLLKDKPDLQTADGESGVEVMSVNGEAFERLVTEIAMSKPYQAPTDRILKLCAECGIEYSDWQTFVINPLPAIGFVEPFKRKLKKLNAGYAFLGHYDLFLYSDRHTMSDYELDPLLKALCEENKAPITYHYVYIDTAGRLARFDLVHKNYKVKSTREIRRKLFSETSE